MQVTKEALVGAWQLESWTVGYSDREGFSSPFGDEPRGLLIYTGDDWMSVSISREGRDPLPTDQSFRSIDDALLAGAYRSYFHYAGRYRLEGSTLTHYVAQSLNPNFVGSEQQRHAELDGATLVLSGRDEIDGTTRLHNLIWHRLGPAATSHG